MAAIYYLTITAAILPFAALLADTLARIELY
jgi:hypothetical protein